LQILYTLVGKRGSGAKEIVEMGTDRTQAKAIVRGDVELPYSPACEEKARRIVPKAVNTPREIVSNAFYLTASHAVTCLLGLAVTTSLTRYLGPAEYGDLTLAYAYLGLFTSLVDAGLSLTLIREASQSPSRLGHIVGNGMMLRGVLTVGGYLLASAIIPLLGYDLAALRLFKLAILILLLSPFSVPRLVFLVAQRIKLVAVLDTIGQLVNTALVLSVVLSRYGRGGHILLVQLVATAVGQCFYLVYGRRLLTQPISLSVDWQLWRLLLSRSWPLAVSGILYALEVHVNRLIVGRVLGNVDGGAYTVAVNLTTAFSFLPILYFSSAYPLLAQYYVADPDRFCWLYRFSFRAMMVIALPMALLASLTGREIIALYAGAAYLSATPLFIALAWMQVLQFAGAVLYYTVLAAGQQRLFPLVSIARVSVCIGLHALLLPWLGLVGAAFATLAMYGVSFGIYGLLKATRSYVLDWLRSALRPGLALLILAVFLIATRLPWLVAWFSGLALYCLLLILLRSVSRGDVQFIRHALGRFRAD
jgi:O-antigen/teichoic acid export membrane protein